MSLHQRFKAFQDDIQKSMEKHNLVFVNGPWSQPVDPATVLGDVKKHTGHTNGQERLVLLLGVADAPRG